MYPKHYMEYFREFERSKRVFVIMPFSEDFKPRWLDIFEPAIAACHLEPWRVDLRMISDSIQTDILHEIAQSRLILADVSVQADGNRNANVMYELGIAHSTRMPEEVIVIKSDEDKLPFDFLQVRYSKFDPADEVGSKAMITRLIENALDEIDLIKDQMIEKLADRLDYDSTYVVAMESTNESFGPYPAREGSYGHLSWAELRRKLDKLQELGVLRTATERDRVGAYVWTELGRKLIRRLQQENRLPAS